MKKTNHYMIGFLLVFLINQQLYAQIVINQSDMPLPGDTIRLSSTVAVPSGFAQTSMDTTWNFSVLQAMSQRVDTFVMATATPSAYQLFFVLFGGANLASPRNAAPIPGLPINNGFAFFKNSSSAYSELGSAYTVQGAPIPAKYDVPDKYYQFPMNPGSVWSSTSKFEITVPSFAYLGMEKTRTNIVDGWGTLITPFGTFQTLRVKSTVIEYDSIYIDSISLGIPVLRNFTEYKWLAKGKGLPVLQINEENNLVTAIYRDSVRMSAQPLTVSLGPDTAVSAGTTITLKAAISGGTPPYQIFWNTIDTGKTLTITVLEEKQYSVMVIDAMQNFGSAQKLVSIKYPPGINEIDEGKLSVAPNPVSGMCLVSIPATKGKTMLKIYSGQGMLVRESEITQGTSTFNLDMSDFPPGLYTLKLIDKNLVYTSKLLHQ